jgi:ribosomal protein L40E
MKTKTKLLAIATVFLIVASTISMHTPRAKSATSGLVGYWNFDEGSGTIVHDSSGNGNDGTLTDYHDTTLPQWVNGVNGSALKFDGVGSFVQVPDSSTLDFSSTVTVMAWIYLPAEANLTNTKILVKNAANGGANLDFGFNDEAGTLVIYMGTTTVYSVGHVPRNSWTNAAMTYSGSFIDIYINGNLDSSHPYTGGFSTNNGMPLCIGSANYQGAAGGTPYGFINANMENVRIYNTALNQKQIQALNPPVDTTTPIWMQWWFWTIIALAAIVAVLAFVTVHYRKKPPVSKETIVMQSKTTQGANKICPKCGATLPANSKFCGKCGTSLE